MASHLSNSKMCVEVSDSGSIIITDLLNNTVWKGGVPGWVTLKDNNLIDKIPLNGTVSVNQTGSSVTVEFDTLNSQLIGRIRFLMKVKVSLSGDFLDVEIMDVDTDLKLISIEYPANILSINSGAENGYTVIPFKQGAIIPSRLDAGFMRFMHNTWKAISDVERILPFDSGALNMPWFGASLGKSGIFCNVMTSADCSLHIIGNAVVNDEGCAVNARQGQNPGKRISALGPVWLSSHGKLGYARKLRMELIPDGYVGMAKRYLEYSKEIGKYVSLKQKIIENPLVERIIGSPDIKIYIYTNRPDTPYYRAWSEPVLNGYSKVHTTFGQIVEMVGDLKKLGIERSLILLGGWNRAGYDREHVDMWPPAAGAGGEEGLSKAGQAVTEEGYLFSLHDNYQDFYTDAPSYDERFIMKNEDESVQLGGVWDGGLCRLICSSQAFELAERNLDLIQNSVPINSYYLDTTTAARLYECFDNTHPVTRSEDRQNKFSLLKFLADRGLIVGGEAGVDWAVPVCTFFEGIPGSAVGYNSGIESADFGIAVPLFNLVYHDAVVCYWQHGQPFGREDHANHVLHDLMSGQPSSWSIVYDQWEDLKPLIKQCYELLAGFHKRTAHYPMVSHEFLTTDFAVHKTCFGDGSEVIVNFGITSHIIDGIKIPPKGFSLKVPGEMLKTGAMNRDIIYR